MNYKRETNKAINDFFFPELFVSIAISFLLFVYAPVEVFYSNRDELYYSLIDILKYMLPFFLFMTALILCVLLLLKKINRKLEIIVFLLAFSGLITLYVQGTVLSSALPPLDGSVINWEGFKAENIKSLMLILSFLGIVLLIYYFIGEKIWLVSKVVSAFLFLMLLLTCIFFCTQCYERNETDVYCTNEKILEMSKDSNLIIFLADQVDAEAFSKMTNIHLEYSEIFENFTFFENTMSGYPWTLRSIPFILSGQWFENEKSYWEYTPEAMRSSPLFAYLKRNNYSMGFYEPEFTFAVKDLPFDNLANKNEYFTYPDKFIKMQIKLSGYRYMPFFLKRFCYISTDDFYFDTLKSDKYSSYSINNSDFYNTVSNEEVTITEKKCFKFLYILGAHTPFDYLAESEQVEDYSYESSIENTISTFSYYLKKLKESGVYDNSAIIFMADHGYAPEYQDGTGRQNPVLFVKGINEHHPFQISDAPVSHSDLVERYPKLAEGAQSVEVFSYTEEDRTRRYLLFAFGEENTMYEYYQRGFASDESSMISTGVVYTR